MKGLQSTAAKSEKQEGRKQGDGELVERKIGRMREAKSDGDVPFVEATNNERRRDMGMRRDLKSMM